MPINFDEFYFKNGKIWGLKLFHRILFSALLQDLNNYQKEGLSQILYENVLTCLEECVRISKQIEENNKWLRSFHEVIAEFTTTFIGWQKPKIGTRKSYKKRLIRIRKKINRSIDREMALVRSKNENEKVLHLQSLRNLDINLVTNLLKVFDDLVEQHENHFPNLTHAIRKLQ